MQYLLSVYQPDGDPPADLDLEAIMRAVENLQKEMQTAGVWVFAGGLHAPSTATVLKPENGQVLTTDGPYVEGKEHLGGFTIIDVPDLDAALDWGRKHALATALPNRGPPLRRLMDVERVFREEYGRAVAVLVRSLGDIDLAEEAVQDAFLIASERWPEHGLPASPAGWIITTARNRAIDRLRREATRSDRHARPRRSWRATRPNPRRRAPCETTACA